MQYKKTGIIIYGVAKPYSVAMWNLIKISASIFNEVHIIGRNIEKFNYPKIVLHSIHHNNSNNQLEIIIRYFYLQLFISYKLIQFRRSTKTWIFFLGAETLLLPILIGKILKLDIILLFAGSLEREIIHRNYPAYFSLLIFIKKMSCCLSTKIIVYSENLIPFLHLEKFRHKIIISHRHFLDFNKFHVTTSFTDRPFLIGYIGRLSNEKGVQHFTQALTVIFRHQEDLQVLIGGDGPLLNSIKLLLQKEALSDRVELLGWISHDNLPKYLNQLRLLVLPSYSEGLPNIMLEAMACGTPVLATPVGAIPDVIIDGVNGFIMNNNSPDCIAENVKRALCCPELEKIAENGRKLVEKKFCYEYVVERWNEIFK